MSASDSTPGSGALTYHPRVADFERREDGTPIRGSLKGPAIVEARQQIARERIIAGAELKLLQERLRTCYHESGVNHYEDCKELSVLYTSHLRASKVQIQGMFPKAAVSSDE